MKQLLLALLLLTATSARADSATCQIKINDVNKDTNYSIEQKFTFKKGGDAQRKHFETPGNDYDCTIVFFELNKGTMLSCAYKKDLGQTFFQSDRSTLNDKFSTNSLTFRHGSAFLVLDVKCE